MAELICNIEDSEHSSQVPSWALNYLLNRPIQEIFHNAASREEVDTIPLDAETCILQCLNIRRVIQRRWIEDDGDANHMMILSLYLCKDGSVIPFIMIQTVYSMTENGIEHQRNCFVEAQWPPRLSGTTIRSTCTWFAIDQECGQRLHLRSHVSNVCFFQTVIESL